MPYSCDMNVLIYLSQELREIDRWLELYETHDKYTFVGHLVDDPVNDILDNIEDAEEVEEDDVNQGGSEGETVAAQGGDIDRVNHWMHELPKGVVGNLRGAPLICIN